MKFITDEFENKEKEVNNKYMRKLNKMYPVMLGGILFGMLTPIFLGVSVDESQRNTYQKNPAVIVYNDAKKSLNVLQDLKRKLPKQIYLPYNPPTIEKVISEMPIEKERASLDKAIELLEIDINKMQTNSETADTINRYKESENASSEKQNELIFSGIGFSFLSFISGVWYSIRLFNKKDKELKKLRETYSH